MHRALAARCPGDEKARQGRVIIRKILHGVKKKKLFFFSSSSSEG